MKAILCLLKGGEGACRALIGVDAGSRRRGDICRALLFYRAYELKYTFLFKLGASKDVRLPADSG